MSVPFFGIVKNFNVSLVGAENLLSPLKCVPGGNVGVAWHEDVEVTLSSGTVATFLQDFKDTREFQNAIHLAGSPRYYNVSAVLSCGAYQVFKSKDTRRVQMTSIL